MICQTYIKMLQSHQQPSASNRRQQEMCYTSYHSLLPFRWKLFIRQSYFLNYGHHTNVHHVMAVGISILNVDGKLRTLRLLNDYQSTFLPIATTKHFPMFIGSSSSTKQAESTSISCCGSCASSRELLFILVIRKSKDIQEYNFIPKYIRDGTRLSTDSRTSSPETVHK